MNKYIEYLTPPSKFNVKLAFHFQGLLEEFDFDKFYNIGVGRMLNSDRLNGNIFDVLYGSSPVIRDNRDAFAEFEAISLLTNPFIIDRNDELIKRSKQSRGFAQYILSNKPSPGSCLWVSAVMPDGSTEWRNTEMFKVSLDYHKVKPSKDCRILVLDSDEKMSVLVDELNFDWDEIAKHFDFVYAPDQKYAWHHYGEDIKFSGALYGWDCVSGVFLNANKFTFEGIGTAKPDNRIDASYKELKERKRHSVY